MRIHCALAVLAALGCPVSLLAQQDSLVRERMAGGISLELPAAWRALSDSQQAAVNRTMDSTLSATNDSALAAQLRAGRPITLFIRTAPGDAATSISLNVAPGPGATASTFDGQSEEQISVMLGPLCSSLEKVMGQIGSKVVSCAKPFIDHVAGHTVAVTRLVRTGKAGFVTVWLAQYPEKDVIYTLSLAAPQAQESRYEPLYRTIWRSLQLSAK